MSNALGGSGTARKKGLLALALVLLCGALALCWIIGESHDKRQQAVKTGIPGDEEEFLTEFPRLATTQADHDTDSSGAQAADLSQAGEELLITEGDWILAGKMNGRIRIAAEKDQNVHLFLNGMTLTSGEGPAIWAESAGKVIITLMEGTENAISDSGNYRKTPDRESCIWCETDLTINGKGTLAVDGLYKDAIRSTNTVKILDGNVVIRCKRSGIHGTDGILVAGGEVDISSEKYGMRTTKNGAEGRGCLVVCGGDHRIIAGRNAFLTGRADLYIYDCMVYSKSVVSDWDVGGKAYVQSGCIE